MTVPNDFEITRTFEGPVAGVPGSMEVEIYYQYTSGCGDWFGGGCWNPGDPAEIEVTKVRVEVRGPDGPVWREPTKAEQDVLDPWLDGDDMFLAMCEYAADADRDEP